MLFISFGKRPPRKRPGFGRKSPFLRRFIGSASAKTFVNKIEEADGKLAMLDKKKLRPESPEYKAELKKWYKQKYSNTISYWEGALKFLQANNASGNEIDFVKRNITAIQGEWKGLQKFLK